MADPAASEAVRVQNDTAYGAPDPSLRFNTLFRRGGPAYRRAVLRLPRQLLAGWFLAAHAPRLCPNWGPWRGGRLSPVAARRDRAFIRRRLGCAISWLSRQTSRLVSAPSSPSDLPAELSQAAAKLDRAASVRQRAGRPLRWRPPSLVLARDLPPDQRASARCAFARR